ncbi:hypothetical protein [Zavarzinella formosa]|uniref:hypothetical protein n=1 Tax=Zavarzinella formosa TaxID=360055 RepID=UPI0002D45EFC|nr:hypothetical protein [Zavarzinella formosa]
MSDPLIQAFIDRVRKNPKYLACPILTWVSAKEVSQAGLAGLLGLDANQLQDLLISRSPVSCEQAAAIAAHFGRDGWREFMAEWLCDICRLRTSGEPLT